jgi:hypothetical protein
MLRRVCRVVAASSLLTAVISCGSSSSLTTEPSPTKCAVSMSLSPSGFGANGGQGTASVTAARECAWSASTDATWIAITSLSSGQGAGEITYQVANNPSPAARTGGIVVNDQRAQLKQDAAACQFTLDHTAATFGAGGGSDRVSVTTIAGCDWTAASNVSWMRVTSTASASGTGTMSLDVQANGGAARSGTLLIAGKTFTVVESEAGNTTPPTPTPPTPGPPTPPTPTPGPPGSPTPTPPTPTPGPPGNPSPSCSYTVDSTSKSIGAAGGSLVINVATTAGCSWTTSSTATWITVGNGAGTGPGSVRLDVTANPGTSGRSATVTVAGQTFSVQQAGALCTYSISPSGASVPATGGASTLAVSTLSGCTWTTTSNAAWIIVGSGNGGNGSGTVQVTASANSDSSPRSGTATIAGQTFTLQQTGVTPPSCQYAINPTAVTVSALGGVATVSVDAPEGCGWTATSGSDWITVQSGQNGSGKGVVQVGISLYLGLVQRTGSVTIAGLSLSVTQAGLISGAHAAIVPGRSGVLAMSR